MQDFKQRLMPDGYFRQEELNFGDCDCRKRARVAALLSRVGAFAGYDYDARGLTHDKLRAMREVFLVSRVAMRIHRCPMAGENCRSCPPELSPAGDRHLARCPYARR